MDKYAGLVLAAGFGTRLKPITETVPKALVKYCGVPLLHSALSRYEAIEPNMKLLVNTHYLGDKVKESLFELGNKVSIYHEETILGTGGALVPMEPEISGMNLIVSNADIVSDFKLIDLVRTFERLPCTATMALMPFVEGTTPVFVKNDQVVGFGGYLDDIDISGCTKHTFSAFSILSPEFRSQIPKTGESSIIATYIKVIEQGGRVSAHFFDGFWYDVGTPASFYQGHMDLLARLNEDDSFLEKIFVSSPNSPLFYSKENGIVSNCESTLSNSNISNSVFISNGVSEISVAIKDSVLIHPEDVASSCTGALLYNHHKFEV